MIAIFKVSDTWRVRLSSFQICAFLPSLLLSIEWKEKQLVSISLFPDKNSLLKEIKNGRTSLSLLLASTIDPLTFNCCLEDSFSSNN